jgi:hypothetical protein
MFVNAMRIFESDRNGVVRLVCDAVKSLRSYLVKVSLG